MKQFFIIIFLLAINQQTYSQKKDSIIRTKSLLLTDRFAITAGLFNPSKSMSIRVNGNLENEIIDFDKSTNNQESTLALNLLYRFSPTKKWSVGVEYFAIKTSKESILEAPLHWGDITYPIGVKLKLGYGFKLYRLFFGRVISRGEKHELIGGLGIHAMDIDSYAQALAYIGDVGFGVSKDFNKNPVSLIAPVPNLGFKYLYAPSKKWSIQTRADYFSLNVSNYGGSLWNLAATTNYQLFNNMGIGLGYKFFKTNLDVSERFWNGNVNILYHGPVIFGSFNF